MYINQDRKVNVIEIISLIAGIVLLISLFVEVAGDHARCKEAAKHIVTPSDTLNWIRSECRLATLGG